MVSIENQLLFQLDKVRILEGMVREAECEIERLKDILKYSHSRGEMTEPSLNIVNNVGCFQYTPTASTEHSSPFKASNNQLKVYHDIISLDDMAVELDMPATGCSDMHNLQHRLTYYEKVFMEMKEQIDVLVLDNRKMTVFSDTIKGYLDVAIDQREEAISKYNELAIASNKLKKQVKDLRDCSSWPLIREEYHQLFKDNQQSDLNLGKRSPLKEPSGPLPSKIKLVSEADTRVIKSSEQMNSPKASQLVITPINVKAAMSPPPPFDHQTSIFSSQHHLRSDKEAEACMNRIFGRQTTLTNRHHTN